MRGIDFEKRISCARWSKKKNHKTWAWWDDKTLQIPSPPPNKQAQPQIRFSDTQSNKDIQGMKSKTVSFNVCWSELEW